MCSEETIHEYLFPHDSAFISGHHDTGICNAHLRVDRFSDGTFNLSNYTITSYPTNGDTVSVTQTLTGGNPGAALEAAIAAPASGGSTTYAFTYALNDTFVYNPSTQGSIPSISFSVDRDIASITGASLTGEAGNSIISQGGNYYEYSIGLIPKAGVWHRQRDRPVGQPLRPHNRPDDRHFKHGSPSQLRLRAAYVRRRYRMVDCCGYTGNYWCR
jgi:hypothetical protein